MIVNELFDFFVNLIIDILNTFLPIFVILFFMFIFLQILFYFGLIKPFGHFDCFGTKNPELMQLRLELLEIELERDKEKEKRVEK